MTRPTNEQWKRIEEELARIPPKQRWTCAHCDEGHDDEDTAAECCGPHVYQYWACPVCGDSYLNYDLADACCATKSDARPLPPTAEEIEAAGQMRLPNI